MAAKGKSDTPDAPPPTQGPNHETPEASTRVKALEEERDRLKAEVKDLRDKFLRARADYENLVKRAGKESETLVQTAKATLLMRIIDASETLDKAIPHVKAAGADAKGLQMVADQLHKTLKDEGVRAVATDNTPFNYRYHMAVERTETGDKAEGTILEVYQKGYTLGDQILRPAMVRVAVPKPSQTQGPASPAAEGKDSA